MFREKNGFLFGKVWSVFLARNGRILGENWDFFVRVFVGGCAWLSTCLDRAQVFLVWFFSEEGGVINGVFWKVFLRGRNGFFFLVSFAFFW